MAKKITRINEDTSQFFEEMEKKMESQNKKRRKFDRKLGHSQPELSFLQFKPKEGTGKEDHCYFNKYFSQPTSNINSSSKTTWIPPMKVLGDSNTCRSETKTIISTQQSLCELDKKFKTAHSNICKNENTNVHNLVTCEQPTYLEKDPSVLLSSQLDGLPVPSKPLCPMASVLSNSNSNSLTNNENTSLLSQKSSCTEVSLVTNISADVFGSKPDENAHRNNHQVVCTPDQQLNCEDVSNRCFGNETQNLIQNQSSGRIVFSVTEFTLSLLDDKVNFFNNKKLVEENINKPLCKSDLDFDNNNKHSKYKEMVDLSEDLTQENFKLKEIKTKGTESKYLGRNFDLSEKDDFPKCNINETERKEKDTVCDYNENEDIINSIDMILSEGQINHSCPEVNKDHNKYDEKSDGRSEEENNHSLVDCVFENSCSNDESSVFDSNNKSILPNNSLVETNEDIIVNDNNLIKNCLFSEISNEMGKEKNQGILIVNGNEDEITQAGVFADVSSLEDVKEKHCRNVQLSSTIDKKQMLDYSKDNNEELNNQNYDCKGDDSKVPDDDYSCLMISNSQLLEIEKNYYETPQNKEQTSSVLTNNSSYFQSETLIEKNTMSVATQTDLDKSLPALTPGFVISKPLQRPDKMMETQRRLRETVKEIQRLNAMLLQVRKEKWPQRNNTK